jgi:RND family efflux transporter MFP subunit
VIQVDGLRVYPTASDVPEAKRHADQGITFRKQQQWQTRGFESSVAATGSLPVGIEAPGEIVPAAGRYAEVSAPIDGLVDPEGARGAPAPGEKVEEGQILAVLTPAHGESGNAVAEARAALREAEHDYARAKRLLEVEAVPKRRVEEARIRLDAARETVDAVTGGAAIAADGRITLRSPIGGVVALRDLSPGSRVEHGTQLFAIVDPSVVWLRAYIPAGEAPRIRSDATASFTLEGGGASGVTSRTVAVGSMVEPETRTVSVLYEVENPDGAIKLGAHAQVLVLTGEIAQGVVVAETAVLEEDGRPVAYVQREAERFERRELVLGPAASGSVVVLEGIAPGERVVTGAVYQVRLASVPTSAPGAGHAH